MSGSNRGKRHSLVEWVIPTLGIVLALLIAGFLGWSAHSDNAYHQGYPHYRYASDKPEQIDPTLTQPAWKIKPLEYRQPCSNPKGHDESDLCAQWKAANAAEDNALWAKWGVWVAGVSTIAVAIAIYLAIEANRIARDTAYESNRPWLTFSISMNEKPIIHPDKIAFSVKLKIKNVGLSPATTVLFEHKIFNTLRKIDPHAFIESDYENANATGKMGFIVTPNETTKRTILIEIPKEDVGIRPNSTRSGLHPMLVVSVCYRAATDSRLRGQSAKGFIIGELAQWANALGSDKWVFTVAEGQGQYPLNIMSLDIKDAYEIGVAR